MAGDMTPIREAEPGLGGAAPPQPGLKFLEATVYIMGGLLVLMLVGLIGGIVWKAMNRQAQPVDAVKELSLDIPASAITRMELDGDRLALATAGEILVIDTRRGTILARVKLKP
jgi:hypothetical protein